MSNPPAHVRVLDASSRSQTAHARAAELVQTQRRLTERLAAFFEEIAEVRDLLRAEGSVWEGPVLDPPVEAAFHAWNLHGPRETRVQLERLGDPPLMPLEPVELPPLRSPDEIGYGAGP